MAIPTTTRRSLLVVAGMAAVTVAAPSVAAETGKVPAISPELLALVAAYDRADASLDQWYDTRWNPAIDAHTSAVEAIRPVTIEAPAYANVLDETVPAQTFSTANRSDVARCKGIVSIPRAKQSQSPKWQAVYRAARQLTAAVKWQERRREQLDRQFGIAALNVEERDLSRALGQAADAVRSFPAASMADLLAKLEFVQRIGRPDDESGPLFELVRDDVSRLLEGGR